MMGGGSNASALLSDDDGENFRTSSNVVRNGGEGTIALAPNGSLLLNTRALQNLRQQSYSNDEGATWSAPRSLDGGFGSSAEGATVWARGFVRKNGFRRYQSGQPTVFSGAYIITVLQYVYTWLLLQFCGRSGPTGTHGNSVPPWHKTFWELRR